MDPGGLFYMSHTLEFTEPDVKQQSQVLVRPGSLEGPKKTIHPELFTPNTKKAIRVLFVGFGFQFLSYAILYLAYITDQIWLLVLGWFLCGMSVTSLFVIGHDCAHGSFLKNQRLNDTIGHFCFLFSFYPFFGWKFSHNSHHAHTNEITTHDSDVYFDNAWTPFTVEEYLSLKKTNRVRAFVYKCTRYFPPIGSLLHNFVFHAFPDKFIKTHKTKLYVSYLILFLGLILFSFGLNLLVGSVFAFVHFLILPGLLFQFWMSFYTFLHHTSTEIRFYEKKDWNPYVGQILSTYNSLCPKWLSAIHFHIDIHTPHHLSTAIPCYHLPQAYKDLKSSEYAHDIKEGKFKLSYLVRQIRECHVWDLKNQKYRRFSEIEGV